MTREDYINKIKQAFLNNIASHSQEFKSHDYFNDNYKTYWKDFFNNLKEVGLAFGNCYHAHNIGNNNEWDLMIREQDQEGFAIEKKVATLFMTLGIYHGVSVWVMDYVTKEEVIGIHFAR